MEELLGLEGNDQKSLNRVYECYQSYEEYIKKIRNDPKIQEMFAQQNSTPEFEEKRENYLNEICFYNDFNDHFTENFKSTNLNEKRKELENIHSNYFGVEDIEKIKNVEVIEREVKENNELDDISKITPLNESDFLKHEENYEL